MYDCYNYNCQLYAFGIPARYNRDGSTRPEWCELVELPEKHGRLIDADALMDKVIAKYLKHERMGQLVFAAAEIKQDICDLISNAPTIIPAEEGE
jgi:hypothetical protein